jgi:hypothetical protein
MLSQKKFAATALPFEVPGVIDVADQIGLLEADNMPVFVVAHRKYGRADGPTFMR